MFANLDNIFIGQRFVRLVILRVLEQHFVHVSRRVLVQFVRTAEDDQSDLAIAQHRQLVGLLHHAEFALVERHLQVSAAIFRRQKNVITWPKKKQQKNLHANHQKTRVRNANSPPQSSNPLPKLKHFLTCDNSK